MKEKWTGKAGIQMNQYLKNLKGHTHTHTLLSFLSTRFTTQIPKNKACKVPLTVTLHINFNRQETSTVGVCVCVCVKHSLRELYDGSHRSQLSLNWSNTLAILNILFPIAVPFFLIHLPPPSFFLHLFSLHLSFPIRSPLCRWPFFLSQPGIRFAPTSWIWLRPTVAH